MADNSVTILDSIYNQAMSGVGVSESVKKLAEDYLSKSGSLSDKVDSLIRWQIAKCGTTGFLTGLGGLLTLPVAISADVGVNLYVQIRMAAAIAYMGGYDVHHDKVKSFVYLTLCGNAMNKVAKKVGIEFAQKIGTNFIKKKISGEFLKKINKAVGTKVITKAGSKGVVNLTKAIPVIGGIIGGAFDAFTTNAVGEAAKRVFIYNKPPIELTRYVTEDEVPDWAKDSISD